MTVDYPRHAPEEEYGADSRNIPTASWVPLAKQRLREVQEVLFFLFFGFCAPDRLRPHLTSSTTSPSLPAPVLLVYSSLDFAPLSLFFFFLLVFFLCFLLFVWLFFVFFFFFFLLCFFLWCFFVFLFFFGVFYLCRREFEVGRFYYLRLSYPAAIARLKTLVDRYPLYSGADEALFLIGQSYEREIDIVRKNPRSNEVIKTKMIDELTKEASDAYDKIITRYPAMYRGLDAKARLGGAASGSAAAHASGARFRTKEKRRAARDRAR